MDEVEIREIYLPLRREREALAQFLSAHGLRLEPDVERAFGLYQGDTLSGCGCACGPLLKCFAIDARLQGQNGLGLLLSRLTQDRFQKGYFDLFVYTRPHNIPMFSRCGYTVVGQTDRVVLLESDRNGLSRYLSGIPRPGKSPGRVGAAVMNCNPFTLGHQHLIQQASSRCGLLYAFVVEEDRSLFPFPDRLSLVREGVRHLPNVLVCPGGPYMISSQTFPAYFLKDTECASDLQSELDVAIFGERIAPALGIQARFAGQEPLDPVPRQYNEAMSRLLPRYGISFVEFPRLMSGSEPVSASRVRKLLETHGGVTPELSSLVPPSTRDYLLRRFGAASF